MLQIIFIVLAFLYLSFLDAQGQEKGSGGLTSPCRDNFSLVFQRGLLSADVVNIPLKNVVECIKVKTHIPLLIIGPFDLLEKRISVKFDTMPLDKGFEKIAGNKADVVFLYHREKTGDTFKLTFIKMFLKSPARSATNGHARETYHVRPSFQKDAAMQRVYLSGGEAYNQTKEGAPEISSAATAGDKEAEVYFLGTSHTARDRNIIVERLSDPDPWVREGAVRALEKFGDEDSVYLLIEALKDTDPSVREAAAYALGQTGDKRAAAPLRNILKDPDEMVRKTAEYFLNKITP